MCDVTIPEDIRVKAEKVAMDVGAGLAIGSAETIGLAMIAERRSAITALLSPSLEMVEAMRRSVPGHLSAQDAAAVFVAGITFILNTEGK